MKKLATRVEQGLHEKVIYKEPKQIDPLQILVNPFNRDGAPPNVQYIHNTLLKNIKTKGFDRTRPLPGICVEFRSEKAKAKLLEHNRRWSKGNPLFPPIHEDQVLYGSLAGSHLNIALRLIKGGCRSPVGDLNSLLLEDEALKDVALNGHRWLILPEDTLKSIQVDISLWRNQDQNDNQGTHEMEIIQSIKATVEVMSETEKKVPIADIVAKVLKRNPAKMPTRILETLAKFYIQFLGQGEQNLINELIDFHSTNVNPKELVVNNAFFEALTSEAALLKTPLLRHYLLLTQYTKEKTRAQAGNADVSVFLEPANIVALVKKGELIKNVEDKLREIRNTHLPILTKVLGESQAKNELAIWVDLIIRCLLCKPWPESFKMKKTVIGKFSNEKIRFLGMEWAKYIDEKHTDMNMAVQANLVPEEEEEKESEEVDLQAIRGLKRERSDEGASGASGSSSGLFKRGDKVTVVRRMTCAVPQKGKKDHRQDIVVGTEGVIQGWADLEQRQVLMKLSISTSGTSGSQEIVHACFPRNLQLTKDYDMEKVGAKEEVEKKEAAEKNSCPAWLRGESGASDIKLENNWTKLLANQDNINKAFWLKSRIGLCLQSLQEVLPSYTSQDLVVLTRKNDRGIPKGEVWTKKAFQPNELLFAPLTSQIKDTHLTLAANAVLNIPKHGRGAHPDGQPLALDGRGKSIMASTGSIDGQEHKGLLFWVIGRTSEVSKANMTIENVTWSHQVTLNMPFKKKKHHLDWEACELPSIPILMNKSKIEKHTQLLVFYSDGQKKIIKDGAK